MRHGRVILVHATSVASWVLFLLLKSLRDWYYGLGSMTLAGTTQLPLGRTNLDLLATKAPAIKHRIPTFVLTARTSKLIIIMFDASAYFLSRGWLRNSNQTHSPSRDLGDLRSVICDRIALIAHT